MDNTDANANTPSVIAFPRTTTITLSPIVDSLKDCLSAELLTLDPVENTVRCLQIIFCSITFILLARLYWTKRKIGANIRFHGNFNLLFLNSLAIYAIFCLGMMVLQVRYLILAIGYSSSQQNSSSSTDCSQLAIPLWFTILARLPTYFQFIALPLVHFAIMCERVRATMFARIYEKEGLKFGLVELALIWAISCLFSAFIAITVLIEQKWQLTQQLVYATLVSTYNAALVLDLHYAILMLVLTTTTIDCWLIRRNWKNQQKISKMINSLQYNLSYKYQVNENLLSMRLMLPLDTSFAVIFIIYLGISIYIRINPVSISSFLSIYDWIYCLNILHGIFSIWLYTRLINQFHKKRMKTVKVRPILVEKQADAHFMQLQAQWGIGLNEYLVKIQREIEGTKEINGKTTKEGEIFK